MTTIALDFDGVTAAMDGIEFNDLSETLPVKGAIEGISSLLKSGYNLHIVTYRKERTEIPKWLKKYNLNLDIFYPKLGDTVPSTDIMLDDTHSKLETLKDSIKGNSYLLKSPKNIDNDVLASFGVYPAVIADQPSFNNKTHGASLNDTPTEVDGVWT